MHCHPLLVCGALSMAISVTSTALLHRMYESVLLLPLESRGPGVYAVKLNTHGNALISSLYVASGTGKVDIKYYDAVFNPNDQYDLNSHSQKDATVDSGETERIVVSLFHDNTIVEATVTDGPVTFGVYATLISHQSTASVFENAPAANQGATPVLAGKNTLGNLVYLPIESGAVKVTGTLTSGASGTSKSNSAKNETGSLTFVDLAAIPSVSVGKIYRSFGIAVACQNEALFEVVRVDDVGGANTETIIGYAMTTPGQSTVAAQFDHLIINTTGGTGIQSIKIRGRNLHKASSLYATISVVESDP